MITKPDNSALRLIGSGVLIIFIIHSTRGAEGPYQLMYYVAIVLAVLLVARVLIMRFSKAGKQLVKSVEPQAASLSTPPVVVNASDLPAVVTTTHKNAIRSVALQTKEYHAAVAVVDPVSTGILWANRAWFRLFDVPAAVFWAPHALPSGPTRELAVISKSSFPSMRRVFREVPAAADLRRVFVAAATPPTRAALGVAGSAHPLRVLLHRWEWEPCGTAAEDPPTESDDDADDKTDDAALNASADAMASSTDAFSLSQAAISSDPGAAGAAASAAAASRRRVVVGSDGAQAVIKAATPRRRRTLSSMARRRDPNAITTQMWAARLAAPAGAAVAPPWVVYLHPTERHVVDRLNAGNVHFVLRVRWPGAVTRRHSGEVDAVSSSVVFQLLAARLLLLGVDQEVSLVRLAALTGARVRVAGRGNAFDVLANTAALARAAAVVAAARAQLSGREAVTDADGPIPRTAVAAAARAAVTAGLDIPRYATRAEAVGAFVACMRDVVPSWLDIVGAEYPDAVAPGDRTESFGDGSAPASYAMVLTTVTYCVTAQVVPSLAADDLPAHRPAWRPTKYDDSAAEAAAALVTKAAASLDCGGGFVVSRVSTIPHGGKVSGASPRSGKGLRAIADDDEDNYTEPADPTVPADVADKVRYPKLLVEFSAPHDRPPAASPPAPTGGPSHLEAAAGVVAAAVFACASARAPMGTLFDTINAALPTATAAALRCGMEASMARLRSADPAVAEDPSIAMQGPWLGCV